MSVAFLPGAESQDGGLMLAPGKWHDPAEHRSILETAVQSGDLAHVGEVASASYRAALYDQNSTARVRAQEEAYRAMAEKVRAATGEVLDDPTLRNTPEIVRRINQGEFSGFNDPRLGDLMRERQDAFLERVAALKTQHPDKLADVDPYRPIQQQGMEVSRQAREGQARLMAREDVGWLAKGAGMLGGALAGGASAPENLLALAAPGGGQGATFLRRLASASLYGAAGGALGAAAAQPDAQAYRRDQGLDYGLAEAGKDVAIGAGMGAALGGGLHAAGEGVGKLIGKLFSRGSTEADLAAAIRAAGREPTPDELASFAQAKAADAGDAVTLAPVADVPADRRGGAATEALAALRDPTAARPGRELRAPADWQDSAAVKATATAKSFDEAVDALRGQNAALSAIASGDPQLRAAGYVATLDDGALGRVRELGVPPEHAAQIARKSGDGPVQAELAQVLSEAKATTVAEVKMILDDHLAAKYAPEANAARMVRPLADGPLAPHRVVDADGRAVVVRPVLVEAADLRTSADPAYPKALQPRDRARAASGQQIREMALRLDPERLGKSAEADRGAPIVGPDRLVESGNGRVAAIREAYAARGEAADAYRAWLQKQGLDIDGMKEPVLIRMRETPLDDSERAAFTLAANKATTLDMSAAERALADARMLDSDMLAAITSPDLAAPGNQDFTRAFVARLPQSEQGRMVTATGQLAPDGLDRIRKAVAARAYGDTPVLSRLADSIDDEVRGLSVALMHAAPDWARLRAGIDAGRVRPEMDVTPELVRAVDMAAQIRQRGETLADRLAQLDAFEPRDGVVDGFLRLFYDEKGARPAASKRVADAIRFYADEARQVSAAADMAFVAPAEATDVMQAWFRKEGLDYAVSRERLRYPDRAAASGDAANGAREDLAANGSTAAAGGGHGARLDAQAASGRSAGDPQAPAADRGAIAGDGRSGDGARGEPRAAGEPPGSAQNQAAAPLDATPRLVARNEPDARPVKAAWRKAAPFRILDDLLAAAPANQATLEEAGRAIAASLGVEFKSPGIKRDVARMQQKLAGAPAGRLTDVVRAGFDTSTPAQADAVAARLAERFPVIDEGWRATPAGYFDRKLNIRFADGMIGEVQMWAPGMREAKGSRGRALYEAWRRLPADAPGRDDLQTQMRAVYAAVFDRLPDDWKASVGSGGSAPIERSHPPRLAGRPSENTSAGWSGDQTPSTSRQASESVQNTGSPSQRAKEGSAMSGVSDEDMRASVFVVNADRAIDARPAELFETADLRAQWVADVVKACRT